MVCNFSYGLTLNHGYQVFDIVIIKYDVINFACWLRSPHVFLSPSCTNRAKVSLCKIVEVRGRTAMLNLNRHAWPPPRQIDARGNARVLLRRLG